MEYKLPDFDEMLAIADAVGRLTTDIGLLKVQLDDLLAGITFTIMNDEEYWRGNTKPPAMNYVIATYHRSGFDVKSGEELNSLRTEIAKKTGEVGKLKMVFSVYRDMVDVWKANQYAIRDSQY